MQTLLRGLVVAAVAVASGMAPGAVVGGPTPGVAAGPGGGAAGATGATGIVAGPVVPATGVAAAPVVSAPTTGFGWPLSPVPSVSRAFQPPSHPYGPGHRGADLVGAVAQPVLAAGDGVVVYAAPLADRGVVSVQHRNGLRTTYEPVTAAVRPGAVVRRGQRLGELTAGHPGCPAPACLHWGLRRGTEYLDPLMLVRPARVRLLPWADAAESGVGPAAPRRRVVSRRRGRSPAGRAAGQARGWACSCTALRRSTSMCV